MKILGASIVEVNTIIEMKTKIILFSFMCMISTISCGQDKKYLSVNPIDNENFFYNEFWYFSEGLPVAINFEEYFFAKDGLFTYCRGYSGGMYWKKEGSGTYTYNPTEKIIHLKTLSGISAPEQITIEKITDTNIVFKGNPILANEDTSLLKLPRKIFHNYNSRVVGVTTDQYWYKGESSSFDCFRFQRVGEVLTHWSPRTKTPRETPVL